MTTTCPDCLSTVAAITKGVDGEMCARCTAIATMFAAATARAEALTVERDEARAGYHALDANWSTIHGAAMTAIREAVGDLSATVPEIVESIATERAAREASDAAYAHAVDDAKHALAIVAKMPHLVGCKGLDVPELCDCAGTVSYVVADPAPVVPPGYIAAEAVARIFDERARRADALIWREAAKTIRDLARAPVKP